MSESRLSAIEERARKAFAVYGLVGAMNHVVMFSSGAGSWAAAKRVAERHGTENLTLLFADVKAEEDEPFAGEDEDNYRFLHEAAENVGGKLVIVRDGRNLHKVYTDEHMLGNSQIAPCSKQLKQIPARKWVEENFPDPESVTLYVGIDWTEDHRYTGTVKGWHPYRVLAPLLGPPYLSKSAITEMLRVEGIAPPRMYGQGFPHANCRGFCCRMGQTQALHLLKVNPAVYKYHEDFEEDFRAKTGKDVAYLKSTKGGESKPLTLKALRESAREPEAEQEKFDWGGCGCFSPEIA